MDSITSLNQLTLVLVLFAVTVGLGVLVIWFCWLMAMYQFPGNGLMQVAVYFLAVVFMWFTHVLAVFTSQAVRNTEAQFELSNRASLSTSWQFWLLCVVIITPLIGIHKDKYPEQTRWNNALRVPLMFVCVLFTYLVVSYGVSAWLSPA
jgi:hypothetical protein